MSKRSAYIAQIEAQAERELAAMHKTHAFVRPLPRVSPLSAAVRTGTQSTQAHAGACVGKQNEPKAPNVELIDAASIRPQAIRWLWPGWLARGKLHVLAGAPGTGKTTIALHMAACVSAGIPFPSGCHAPSGNVIVWSGEDDPADTLTPRLIAAGADLTRVKLVGAVTEKGQRRPFDPARDVPSLAAAMAALDGVSMIVVDPLVSAVQGDSHKNAEVRRGLQPLVDLAAQHDAALIGITHYSKGTVGRDPLERVTGSIAFGALARIVFGTVRQKADDGDDQGKIMLARAKSNIGPDGGGFLYALEQVEIPGNIHTSRVTWGAAVAGTARELLAEAESGTEHGNDATTFLRDLLADGSMAANGIYADAKGAGFSIDQMKRAKGKIGAVAFKEGMKGAWYWRLPKDEESVEGSEGSEQERPHSSHSSDSKAPPSGGVDPVRNRLIALCLRNGIDGDVARELSNDDVQACAGLDDGILLTYLRDIAKRGRA